MSERASAPGPTKFSRISVETIDSRENSPAGTRGMSAEGRSLHFGLDPPHAPRHLCHERHCREAGMSGIGKVGNLFKHPGKKTGDVQKIRG